MMASSLVRWRTALAVLTAAIPFLGNAAEKPMAADFYVSVDGNDAWSGQLVEANGEQTDGPFATLTRARDAVRSLLQQDPRDVTVAIRGGEYRLMQTVVFSRADSAPEGCQITYRAYPGERPLFTSAEIISQWQPVEGRPGNVWFADVSALAPFRSLFDESGRLPRAKGTGFSPTNITPRGSSDYQTVQFPSGALPQLSNLQDVELRIVPSHFWTMNLLPVAAIDYETRTLRTAVPGTYPLGRNGMTDRDNAWIENALEVLDEPGEWVLDTQRGRLYLWPRTERPENIRIPRLTELIRVEGEIDYQGPQDLPVRGLIFQGLTFAQADCYAWHGRTGWGLQHDWECFDKPTALLRFRGAEECRVLNCEFRDSGHTAIRLDLHCQRNQITGNHIHHIGGVGVLLAGYGPGTKDVNRDNAVTNNYIHHIGQQYWGSAAVFAWQSGGNRISHNHISHLPYTAILSTGRIVRTAPGPAECSRTIRWHETPEAFRHWDWAQREPYLHSRNNLIEYNDIHDAMEKLGDGNCIYVSGAGGGTVVQYNFCHDCYGQYMNAVIRCDDDQHQTLIRGNVCCRTGGQGEGLISKGDNDIVNNVIADLRPNHDRHRGYIVFPYGDIHGTTIQANILYSRRKHQVLYYHGHSSGRADPPPRLQDTETDGNLYFCTEDPHWADQHLSDQQAEGNERRSVQANPRFTDVDANDFTFLPDSPALKLGIKPLDTRQVGLEPEFESQLMGRRLRTRIEPAGGNFRAPLRVSIACSDPSAEIRYTLDGSEPVRSSLVYSGPFRLTRAAVVRARAFAEHATDAYGARAEYIPPPAPIRDDFEASAVGDCVRGATTSEDPKRNRYTVRVTDQQAAGGRHSLKFVDGPGQDKPFTPHVFYNCRFVEGQAIGSFDIRLDAATAFSYQWRQYTTDYVTGPTVTIRPQGRLLHGGKVLAELPLEQWIHVEVQTGLGEQANGSFELRLRLPGETQPRVFSKLAQSPKFSELTWFGFVSQAEQESTYYLDNIQVMTSECAGPGSHRSHQKEIF